MPERTYLITPGPTPVPPEVAAAMARPLIHHRSPDFKVLLEQTLAQLRRAFATEQEVLLFAGSGTSAMESAVANLLSPGDDVLVASAGNFGDRWTKIARAYGIEPRIHAQPWGEALDPAAVAGQAQGAVAAYITHSETSTGVVHDVRAIAEALRPTGALLVVDAVSSLGGVELAMDEWGVDVVVSGSQKALMTPPGLAFVAASERAWAISEQAALPRFTLDWRVTRDSQDEGADPVHAADHAGRRAECGAGHDRGRAAPRTCGRATGCWAAPPARARRRSAWSCSPRTTTARRW